MSFDTEQAALKNMVAAMKVAARSHVALRQYDDLLSGRELDSRLRLARVDPDRYLSAMLLWSEALRIYLQALDRSREP